MSFGLKFVNNQNTVTLDSEFARLCVISSGRYLPNHDHGLGAVSMFPRAVTSQEPPLVFIRPDTVAGIGSACQMYLIGGPGNWTGFNIRAHNVHHAQPHGRYFVAAFLAQPAAQFGMRLWDASSRLVFDSDTPSALFTRSFSTWAYIKSEQTATTGRRNYYRVDFHFPDNEYLMINSFGMRLLSGDNVGRSLATWWDFSGGNLWAITDSFINPYDFHLPAVFAKING